MTISDIRIAAELSGITSVVSNSTEKIETQLNRITGIEELPIMMVAWDLKSTLTFNPDGFLEQPPTDVTVLLLTKADGRLKGEYEDSAEKMAELFQVFIQNLNSHLIKYNQGNGISLTNISYTLTPKHGMGKHSGILGNFTMLGQVKSC